MSKKRSMVIDLYKPRKRFCAAPSSSKDHPAFNDGLNGTSFSVSDIPSDTKVALLHLQELFPLEKFEFRLPPVIVKHQLYSILKDKTLVDKQLNDLRNAGEIRIFRLGADSSDYCIVFTEKYKDHVLSVMSKLSISQAVSDKFVSTVIKACNDVCISKNLLMEEYCFKDEEITMLVKASVLTVRDVGSWWISVPNAGLYMKSFLRGRKSLLTMIRKCKYREILRKELEQRKLPKTCKLGLAYHIHDVIGADLIECIQTASGDLLRLKE